MKNELNSSVGSANSIDQESIIYHNANELNKLFTGTFVHNTLIEHKNDENDGNYFVLKPTFMKYTIPGLKKDDKDFKEYYIEKLFISQLVLIR